MGIEIERKFLVTDDSWKQSVSARYDIVQAFLSKDPERTVRVRIKGEESFITIKGKPPADKPLDTPEFEYAIPVSEARALLTLCLPGTIDKTRHIVNHEGNKWEVDVFHGANEGLVMAELELRSADETFDKPEWLGQEVTADHRYKNTCLSERPFSTWSRNVSHGGAIRP